MLQARTRLKISLLTCLYMFTEDKSWTHKSQYTYYILLAMFSQGWKLISAPKHRINTMKTYPSNQGFRFWKLNWCFCCLVSINMLHVFIWLGEILEAVKGIRKEPFPSRSRSSWIYDLPKYICVTLKMLEDKSANCSVTMLPWQGSALKKRKYVFMDQWLFPKRGALYPSFLFPIFIVFVWFFVLIWNKTETFFNCFPVSSFRNTNLT